MAESYTMNRPMTGHRPTVLVASPKSQHATAICECAKRITVHGARWSDRQRALEWAYRDHLVDVVEARR